MKHTYARTHWELSKEIYNLLGSKEEDDINRLRQMMTERSNLEKYLHRELKKKD